MRELIVLLDEMLRANIVQNYAVFGALAQMRYTGAFCAGCGYSHWC
jgi:hypothetical protein